MDASITTVIPTYRRPRQLKRAIRSALNQTRPDLIVAVYDNASGDETPEAVAEAAGGDSRVHYYCHPENIGMARNFEFAMRRVQTPYFSFLSDDDLILPGLYEEAIAALEAQPSAMFFAASTILENNGGTVAGVTLSSWQQGLYHPPDGLYRLLRDGCPNWTSMVFRREMFSRLGFLDPQTGTIGDMDLMLRAAARYSFYISTRPGSVFFVTPVAQRRRLTARQVLQQHLKVVSNINDFPAECRDTALRLFAQGLGRGLFFHARNAALDGDREEALESARLLDHYVDPDGGASSRVRFLLKLNSFGLRPVIRLAASATRLLRHEGVAFALGRRRHYQEMVDQLLRDVGSEATAIEQIPRPFNPV